MAQPASRTFGKYQILERIATGGMAEIYKARLEGIGGFQRTFAIKRILPHLSANNEYVAMLVDEAKVAGLLSHANIVQILDLGQVDGIWYIAMEFVDGYDLGAVLERSQERNQRVPIPHACFMALELLKGLEYAHQRQVMRGGRPVALNIIHRDITPPNILISRQGEVKLTDFGIARASLKAMETQADIIKGRFDYMSPEQAAGSKNLDQRSDLFSVGVVLYESLTGTHPFRTNSELDTLERVRRGEYEPLSRIEPEIPLGLETIVDRCLRVDRRERFASATALKEAINKFFHESSFLFSHATLAQYLRGLFPENNPDRAPVKADDLNEPPTHLDAPSTEVSPEGPTRIMNKDVLNRQLVSSESSRGFGIHRADEQTEVRRNPLVSQGTVDAEDVPNTAVQQKTFDAASLSSAPVAAPPPEEGIGEILDRIASQPDHGESRERTWDTGPLTPAGWDTATLVLIAGTLVLLGIAVGGLLVGTAQILVAKDPEVQATSVPSTPMLRVQAPPGSTVLLDGQQISGQVNVSPGRVSLLTVELQGYAPWEQEVQLDAGEHRVIILMTREMKPL